MKIYTKTGDIGETSLWGGKRVMKSELQIDAYGTIDELNAWIGLLRDTNINEKKWLQIIQDKLFEIGAYLACNKEKLADKDPAVSESDIENLEKWIDQMTWHLTPLKNFILPGGHINVSYCHIARTVCRRAERIIVALNNGGFAYIGIIKYINRLSDFLFTLSRKTAVDLKVTETIWKSNDK